VLKPIADFCLPGLGTVGQRLARAVFQFQARIEPASLASGAAMMAMIRYHQIPIPARGCRPVRWLKRQRLCGRIAAAWFLGQDDSSLMRFEIVGKVQI